MIRSAICTVVVLLVATIVGSAKPAGNHSGTLVNALLHHIKDLSGIGGEIRPGIVHRLDKGTSGVMVIAKNDEAHQELARQFHDREVEKEYVALVWGLVQQRKRINAAIDYRESLRIDANAYRVVHGEADGIPSFVVDRYDNYLVVQILSAGLEVFRELLDKNDKPVTRTKLGEPIHVRLRVRSVCNLATPKPR